MGEAASLLYRLPPLPAIPDSSPTQQGHLSDTTLSPRRQHLTGLIAIYPRKAPPKNPPVTPPKPRENQGRRLRCMGIVLSGIADGEVIEGGGHDPDPFVGVAAADEDEAELEVRFKSPREG